MVELGIMYEKGEGVSKDHDRAVSYWERAAEAGNSAGYLWLGKSTISSSVEEAIKYLSKAEKLGNSEASRILLEAKERETEEVYRLGLDTFKQLYFFSNTNGIDVKKCFSKLREVAAKGHQDSINLIFEMDSKGKTNVTLGNKKISMFSNDSDIFNFVRESAKYNNPIALRCMGKAYANGLYGVKKNIDTAVDYYKKAADLDDSVAMTLLAELYEKGYGDLDEEEEKIKVLGYYQKAADIGNANGFFGLFLYYSKKDFSKAENYCERALRLSEDIKSNSLNYSALAKVISVPGTVNASYKNPIALSDKDKDMMCMFFAAEYEFTVKNLTAAKKWYKKLAESSSEENRHNARLALERIYESENRNMIAVANGIRKLSEEAQRKQVEALERMADNNGNKSSSSGGGCFISSAVCYSFGKPDDCYELSMFRRFRDTWLAIQPNGGNLIEEYYEIAPKIVAAINKKSDAKDIYKKIWAEFLSPCLTYLENGKMQECKETYIEMVLLLKRKFFS